MNIFNYMYLHIKIHKTVDSYHRSISYVRMCVLKSYMDHVKKY